MAELMEVYRQSLAGLQKRYDELMEQRLFFDKRTALLEEEMDELWEAMHMMEPHHSCATKNSSPGNHRRRIPGVLELHIAVSGRQGR